MSLEVKDLTISFAEGGAVTENISFQVKPGNMLSIVGGSGAGKTTICRAIMGLLGTTYKIKGGIFYNRTNLLEMSHTMLEQIYGKDICFIAQNPMTAFNPSIKLEKQLRKTYLQHQKRISKRDIRDILIDMLQRFVLEDGERILRGYPFEMSGGMLQRLMIIAALINKPKILVADEATTAIDACNRKELMEQLRCLCEEGMSILFVTHDLKAASYSNQIFILDKGKMVEYGETKTVLSNPREKYTEYLLNSCHLERKVV